MRLLILTIILALATTLPRLANGDDIYMGTAIEAVSDISWHAISSSSSPPGALVGWEFTVGTPIMINALGIYTNTTVASQVGPVSAGVSLWNGSGTQLASCQVLPNDSALSTGFKYHSIPSVTLQPGQDYTVACLLLHSESWVSDVYSATFAQGIDFVGRRFAYANDFTIMPVGDFPGFDGIPVGTIGGFGASFTFTPVPEPSTVALVGLPVMLLIFRRLIPRRSQLR
jgi:hypothetical protein